MFWILRRTGAANFFNSINNNNSSKSGPNNNNNSDKNNQRPPRKAYGRLSVESDDTNSMNKVCATANLDNRSCHNTIQTKRNQEDNHGNFDESDSDIDDNKLKQATRNRRIDENTISRLQAMAMSDDDDDYDESLTCNVCDRAFHCHRQLASHQQKKRHFGCSGCDSLFPSLMLLEHHKEEFEHWSDGEEENRRLPCCRRNRADDDFTDTDTITSDAESEDMERLL